MSTTEPIISDKTVTHPTDVMCWDDLPSEACAMEFRPPSAMQLRCTWKRGIVDLTKVSCVVGAAFWLIKFVVLPQLSSPWNRLGLVGAVAGVVVGALTLAMAPSSKRVQTAKLDPSSKFSWTLAIAVAGCVVLCFSPALNLTGGLVYAGTGLALLAILARQLVCHQVGWHTANPQILASDRDPWRAGARKLNIALASGSNDMKNLAIEGLGGFAVVSAGLVLQPLCYLGCSWAGVRTWSWWVPPLTLATLLVFDRIWVRHSKSSETFAAAMGHWFDYQKNGESSPLVYQSPAGSAAPRTFLVWHVVAVLTVGMATMISNIEFFDQLGAPMTRQDRAIVALMDTALAAITVPWLVWYGLKIITAPALVAAWALHEFPSTKNADPESKPKEQHHACTNDSRSL